jgi:hypothetical protein
MRGQYRNYFRPIYLDMNAIEYERFRDNSNHTAMATIRNNDPSAAAAVELHEWFYTHYEMRELKEREALSLNDFEALLTKRNPGVQIPPLPPASKVISIFLNAQNLPQVLGDGAPYWPKEPLQQCGVPDADIKFRNYLAKVTEGLGSYHHVTIGTEENWVGRTYLAFRIDEAFPKNSEWIEGVKAFSFEAVAPVALAGTFLRNPGIIGMLTNFSELLSVSDSFSRHHRPTIEQFAGSIAQRTRERFAITDEVNSNLSNLKRAPSRRIPRTQEHIENASRNGHFCVDGDANPPLSHALEHCSSAGKSFISDIASALSDHHAFGELPDQSRTLLAHVLAFGLTGLRDRPKGLTSYFKERDIWEAAGSCQSMQADLDLHVPSPLHPFVRALLVLASYPSIVRADAVNKMKLELNGRPLISIFPPISGKLSVAVTHSITGTLDQEDNEINRDLKIPTPRELHEQKAGLILYFGANIFDDFEMAITTTTGLKALHSTYRWKDATPAEEGKIKYAFRFRS